MKTHSETRHATPSKLCKDVSVVVVNYNGGEQILRSLASVYEQTLRPAAVIVVDNASTDGSPACVQQHYPDVQIEVMPENTGSSGAKNVGLGLANTELVLLLDDDVYLKEQTLETLLEAYAREQPAVICPRVCFYPDTERIQADGTESHFLGLMSLRNLNRPTKQTPSKPTWVGGGLGACLLVRRADVLAAGGFNGVYFILADDFELSYRLTAMGHSILCVPEAVVEHDRGEGTPGISYREREPSYPAQRAYLTMRNRLITIHLHYNVRTYCVLLPVLLVFEAIILAAAAARGLQGEWARAWIWQFEHIPLIRQLREQNARHRRRRDRDVLVGGPIPLAPGLLRSRLQKAAAAGLSALLNTYWLAARHLIN